MSDTRELPIRDARDRLIDLLGFGETYPLRDLSIRDERLTVPFNTSAKIPIEASQADVLYQLYSRDDQPVKQGQAFEIIEEKGTGATLLLESPLIEDDVTYKVRAIKDISKRATYLHETATVKVGLDVTLKAGILSGDLLDPGTENPTLVDPRIVDYGSRVEVFLKESQEGVDYTLVYFKNGAAKERPLSETGVRGNLDNITLLSLAVQEDLDIRIRATKTFDPSEGRETQTDLLEVILPLKVKANTSLDLSFDPKPVIDFKESATLNIENTQKSVQYQLFIQNIPDLYFIHGEAKDVDLIQVPIGDSQNIQVLKPKYEKIWSRPEGFIDIGNQKKGTGGRLQFLVDGLNEDSMIIVQAEKTHLASREISSALRLEETGVILVRPNATPGLHLKATIEGSDRLRTIEVSGGQTGVFYHLRPNLNGKNIALPAYFHKKDAKDETQNKGLGQLRMGVDFVVSRNLPEGAVSESAHTFPLDPLIEIKTLQIGTKLSIFAIKAQTGLGKPLTKGADIPVLPKIAFENETVDVGTVGRIIVFASQVGEKYTLTLNGKKVKTARNGNGSDITLTTDPLNEATQFEMVVTRPKDSNISVERILLLTVGIRPPSG